MSGKTHAPPDLKKYVHLCACVLVCVLAYVCVVVGLSFLFFYVLSFLFLCLKSFVRLWCGVVWCLWCGALWCGTHLLRATTCTVLVLVIENKKWERGVCETGRCGDDGTDAGEWW